MVKDDVLVLVLAGGVGERLSPLTKERAKPAVYFGGPYRIIDFVLSNCLNSGFRRIYIATQYKSLSLNRHIRQGWNIVSEELGEFLEILPPQKRVGEQWYQGTADAVYQNMYSIVRENPRHVIILAGDHIYKMDYRRMLQSHLDTGAAVTLATIEVPVQDGRRFGIVHVDEASRVIGFQEKPADPASLPRQVEFNQRAIERLGALPGVTAAGGIDGFPLGGGGSAGPFLIIRGDEPTTMQELMPLIKDPSRSGHAQFRVASDGYFGAMGIPLVRGRLFDSRDTARAPHVAVISESLARTRWPDKDPIGVRIQFGLDGDMTPFTIVGIVGDVREGGHDSQPLSMFYADYRQRPLGTFDFNVVLQTSVDPATVIPAARQILKEMAPDMAPRFRTVREAIDASTASRRFTLGLTSFFAGSAMLLALLGVYGVLSYLVEQRRQEFGVRMALGARPSDVRRLVMSEAAWLIVIGLGLGVGGSLALSRVLDGVLFGITATDVVTYVSVTTLLGLAALVAGQLPAIRATRVNPVTTLHEA